MRTRLFNAAKMIVGSLLLASVPACNLDPVFTERRPPKGPTASAENPRGTGLPPSSALSTAERHVVDLVESVLAHRAQYHQELEELRDYYRETLLGRVDKVVLAKSKVYVLEALLRLRQAACHPGLIDESRLDAESAKMDALLPMVSELVEEGHKALIFSQFTKMLAIVRIRLDTMGVT